MMPAITRVKQLESIRNALLTPTGDYERDHSDFDKLLKQTIKVLSEGTKHEVIAQQIIDLYESESKGWYWA